MAVTRQSFGRSVLSALNLPVTDQNLRIMIGWQDAEGGAGPQYGVAGNTANYNPINTTQTMPGSTSVNSVNVQSYVSWEQGLEATLDTLNQSNMSSIRQMLASGNASAEVAASTIDTSNWGTKGLTAAMISGALLVATDAGDPIQTVVGGGVFGLGGTGNSSNPKIDSLWTVGDSSNPDQDYWTTSTRCGPGGRFSARRRRLGNEIG